VRRSQRAQVQKCRQHFRNVSPLSVAKSEQNSSLRLVILAPAKYRQRVDVGEPGQGVEVVAVVEAVDAGAVEVAVSPAPVLSGASAGASMMTVLVDVAVRPD
jgi:hypothetical protein